MKTRHTSWLVLVILLACGLAIWSGARATRRERDEGFISASELRPVRAVREAVRASKRRTRETVESMVSGLRGRVRGGARTIGLID